MGETPSANVDGGKESPRETNSKDSPASQADSGVFSIASSASPSKVDGVLNTDVRSPESPSSRDRIPCLDSAPSFKPQDVSQWKSTAAMKSGLPLTMSSSSSPFPSKGETGCPDPTLPQGIHIPNNLSITRVQHANLQSSPNSSNAITGGPIMTSAKTMPQMIHNTPWNISMNANGPGMASQFFNSALHDDRGPRKRGRPRKNTAEGLCP